MSTRRQALGRGLGALLGSPAVSVMENEPTSAVPPVAGTPEAAPAAAGVRFIRIEDILPNPHQPRQRFSQDSLRELADSIKAHGVLQPILVTSKRGAEHEEYFLLAGERRFRASQLAELERIPALIRDVTEEEMLEIALIENIQRDDLNAVEEAKAYRALMDSFGWSQEQTAHRVGKKRSTVANSLRLLRLGDDGLRDLEEGRLTPGHARAILSLENPKMQERLRQEIVNRGISVREAERRAIQLQSPQQQPPVKPKKNIEQSQQGLDTVALEERLMAHLGCRVKIRTRDGRSGSVEVLFSDLDELQRYLDAIGYTD